MNAAVVGARARVIFAVRDLDGILEVDQGRHHRRTAVRHAALRARVVTPTIEAASVRRLPDAAGVVQSGVDGDPLCDDNGGCPDDLTCSGGYCRNAENDTCAPADRVARIAVGGAHACVIDLRGQLSCWGDNTHGQVTGMASEPVVFAVNVTAPVDAMLQPSIVGE